MPTNESLHQPEDPETRRRHGVNDEGPETEAHARQGLLPGQQDDPEVRKRHGLQDEEEGPETEAHIRRA